MIINESSYISSLRAIKNGLEKEGYKCRVNADHRCVDVLDDSDNTIEQHYPEETAPKEGCYYKYINVGKNNGSYERTKVPYDKRNFLPKIGMTKQCKVIKKSSN